MRLPKEGDCDKSTEGKAVLSEVTPRSPDSCHIIGMRVDATTYDDARARIVAWARTKQSQYVCAANVHMAMEANDDGNFRKIIENAGLVTPDGMPLVWMMRRLGHRRQARVYGPRLMLETLRAAEMEGLMVGFYGGSSEELQVILGKLKREYPKLEVSYLGAPPFRPLTAAEEAAEVAKIRESGVDILFVGLGCPKQEQWMARNSPGLPIVMLGVGAAFAFYAGTVRQAPVLLQKVGMEWAFRLFAEPRRLWRRYLKHNPRFVVLAMNQLWRQRR